MSTSSITSRRSLHLVDLENLVGDPYAGKVEALDTFDDYLRLARWQTGDHVLLAVNPWLGFLVTADLPVPANVHWAHGQDGSDIKLLSFAPPELVTRFGRLVIGSGDGIFAARAGIARDLGVEVEVVTRPESCSTRLTAFRCSFMGPSTFDLPQAG